MNNFRKQKLTLLGLIFLAGCGGGGGGGGGDGGTSGGGGYGTAPSNATPTINNSTSSYSVAENQTSGFTVSATDSDGDTLTYSITGEDSSAFTVNSSGVVSFNTAPDFETPSDTNSDNIYSISISVSDGTASASTTFTITVTNDTSDDNTDTAAAWDGVLLKNDTYKPYDKYAVSYNLIIGGLPDVTDEFVTNVANIANRMLAQNDATNSVNRDLLLENFNQFSAFQRVGSTNMSSYDPALNNENYDGWDNINDNYAVVDFIWEATSNSSTDEQTKAGQINAILEHMLHTITLIFDKSFTSWGYEDASSDLVLAMNEAIAGGFYDPTGNYGSTQETNPTLYSRIIAQEFAYWMILTGWDLKSLYAADAAPEWTILTAAEMETNLPLAQKLFTDTVNGVLVNPTQAYLDGLTFGSLPNLTSVAISVSVAANNAGSGNVYVIDGVQKSTLTFEVGKTYTLTHPTGHPLRFSTTDDGTHGGGTAYTSGVDSSTDGVTIIEVTADTPTTLYYYCSIHSGMGSSITTSS
ncbi:hypothetical protein OAJ62_01165 [Pseudomonadota bacterium]|nr:hypothetical protein [Pseudomonadota bacterium]